MNHSVPLFVAVLLGYNKYWPSGFIVLWFYVQEHPKTQPAVVLILKRFRRRDHGLKSHPTFWEKPAIEPATPVLQGICLSPTPRRLHSVPSIENAQFDQRPHCASISV